MKCYSKSLWFLILVWIIMIIGFGGCKSPNLRSDRQTITVSIIPQKYFIEQIAKDRFNVNVMIPTVANHENYDPTPRQIAGLADTRIYFRIGEIEFENTWIKKFTDIYPDLKVINLSENLEVQEHSADDHHGRYEPHTWLSPRNVKSMSKTIFDVLTEMDQQNHDFYKSNYDHFLTEIDSVDSVISGKLADLKSRSFIIYHPALTYFSHDYNLKQFPLEIEGKSPTPYLIKELIELAGKESIHTVVVQKEFDQTRAEIIARETGSTIITIDPTDYHWSAQMISIADKLSEALNK